MGHEQAEQHPQEETKAERRRLVRFAKWFSAQTGATYPLFRPVPEYSLNPFYWLGALSVVAFIIQGITGVIMMLYYVPTTGSAYTTTQYIFKSVYFGQFLETIHLYTAYAMIMLAFMHMMRGYFVSVQKSPRQVMWMVGMLMGFVTLGFGFTGYLLPWTVVSTSASNVGIGMMAALPAPIANLANFLVVGTGGDATELLRFYDLHVIVLPAVLLGLLAAKMYMLETHGVAEPVTGKLTERLRRTLPIFPDVTVYLLELAVIFGVGMLLVSALFPIQLGPEYSPQAAAAIAAQPDWYFLWIYQILKINVFETAGLPVALTFVAAVMGALVVLPFIDRGQDRRIIDRPKYVILGVVFIAELIVLAAWGLITPGQIISNLAAVEVLGGTALVATLATLGVYAAVRPAGTSAGPGSSESPSLPVGGPARRAYEGKWMGLGMTGLMAFGALAIGILIDSAAQLVEYGMTTPMLSRLSASLCLLIAVVTLTLLGLRRVGRKLGSGERQVSRKVWSRLGLS
ncbi:MAG TPA: cytochrome bc complex cytochrome b subunit [Nitrososphaerales archaeon]|nr:cytochrome bc complex cytochrome b subunit [Nitrososphaerales archaeon]